MTDQSVRADGFVGRNVSAQDGLKLYIREYGWRISDPMPVVCLPGLTRNSSDFHELASVLAKEGRRVLSLDYRGRGRSAYDSDPKNYSLEVELGDVVAVLVAEEIRAAVFIGTSRGGILTMLLAATRPTFIAGAVLNDIGPVIDIAGLMRIKSYVGKMPAPRTYDEAAAILRRMDSANFPKMTDADWREQARRIWLAENGALRLNYDQRLSSTLEAIDPQHPLPALWPQFDALSLAPLMVIRGANSDLLSAATVQAMGVRRADMDIVEAADQGHAPFLRGDLVSKIVAFVERCGRPAHGSSG